MGLFRRKQETLNEQLLREAGLEPAQSLGDPPAPTQPEPEQLDPPRFPRAGVNLGHSPRRWDPGPGEWDAVATARVPGLRGNRAEFATLPSGDIIVEEETSTGDLSPLADAVERKLEPPYRAVAARQDADLWGVGAIEIAVVKFELTEGDAVELTENDGVQEVRVDGEPSDAEIPELERLGEEAGASYCVEAKRIDGNFWEVEVSAL